MASSRLTARACALLATLVCASACGDETTPPPAARKPVERGTPGADGESGADAARGPNDPRIRDAAMREGDAAIDGGGVDASLNDAAAVPMMLEDAGDRAGTGGVGGVGGVGGGAGTSGIGGVGGEGGGAAVAGTFRP